MIDFKTGDIVITTSHKYKMTVEKVDSYIVYCGYFDSDNQLHREIYNKRNVEFASKSKIVNFIRKNKSIIHFILFIIIAVHYTMVLTHLVNTNLLFLIMMIISSIYMFCVIYKIDVLIARKIRLL